jgi:HTH-type transcriptional repressor of NAD biosynthesis genes
MKRFERALVVGKFAPLHRGHESVIARAFELADQVLVVSYTKPEFDGCEPALRRRWLSERFPEATLLVWDAGCAAPGVPPMPHNDDPATLHRRFVGSLCRDVLGVTVDAVVTSEAYGPGFARELEAFFRERDPRAPAVTHVPVDPERTAVPISGSAIRADVHAHRRWLSDGVYASFVRRVTLLGGESSGKSTLARELARHFGTEFVSEYGRDRWEQKGGSLELEDMVAIAERQVALEDAALRRSLRYLFCDTSPLTTLLYSRDLFGAAEPRLIELAQRRYDVTVLCAPDVPFVQDGTRRDAAFRAAQHARYLEELGRRGVPFLLAEGTLADRIAAVARALGGR